MRGIDHVVSKIIQCEHDKGNIKHSTDGAQLIGLASYLELLDECVYGAGDDLDIDVAIGSAMVSLINICERNGTSMETCLNKVYKSKEYRS
jgi:hypothetical protein